MTGTNAVSLAAASVAASGATGGGAIRIGGDFHGASAIGAARTTTIDSASTLNASATGSGDGGTVAVWSDAKTSFAGTIAATGGPRGGNGGYVEVSANPATHGELDFTGSAVLTARKGATGTLLLDPYDVTICGYPCSPTNGAFSGSDPIRGIRPALHSSTSLRSITTLFYANVIVSTGSSGGNPARHHGACDSVSPSDPITWSSKNNLTLTAARSYSSTAPHLEHAPDPSPSTPAARHHRDKLASESSRGSMVVAALGATSAPVASATSPTRRRLVKFRPGRNMRPVDVGSAGFEQRSFGGNHQRVDNPDRAPQGQRAFRREPDPGEPATSFSTTRTTQSERSPARAQFPVRQRRADVRLHCRTGRLFRLDGRSPHDLGDPASPRLPRASRA